MERCYGRAINNFKRGLFQGGIVKTTKKPLGYYHELRCDKMVTSGKLCERCIDRRITEHDDTKKLGGNLTILWHGLVTEPITSDCIFGGPGFLANAKEYGISQENLQLGLSAHAAAVAGLNGVPPLPDMSAMVKEGITPVIVKKTKVPKAKKGEVSAPVSAPVQEQTAAKKVKAKVVAALAPSNDVRSYLGDAPTVDPPLVVAPPQLEVKTVRKKKVVAAVAPPPPQPVAILSEEKPVDVEDVETIDVVSRELNGTNYYLDTRKNKVYNPKNGSYVGRWDSVTQKLITTIPDSDAE
jgi:hypothetical protein